MRACVYVYAQNKRTKIQDRKINRKQRERERNKEKERMNRAEGLVRRNKSRADNSNAEANSSTSNGGVDENDVIINERGDDDIDDNDSKETRLTLMEEVLLLGLKDKEVGVQRFQLIHMENFFRPAYFRKCPNGHRHCCALQSLFIVCTHSSCSTNGLPITMEMPGNLVNHILMCVNAIVSMFN